MSAAGHEHSHSIGNGGRGLLLALILTVGLLALEVAVGIYSNSLALLSDSGHILTDVLALGLAWFAMRRASRPADSRYTFGYGRGGILAALVNAVVLIVIALVIAIEAAMRLRMPQAVQGTPVIVAAAIAVAVNSFIALRLLGGRHANLNVRAALLHVVGDIAASVAVIISALLILLTGWHRFDPLVSVFIAALITFGAWRIVTESLAILMEATPADIDLASVVASMKEIPGVADVHDLHIWQLSDGFRLLSAHVAVPDQQLSDASDLLFDLRAILRSRYQVRHSTIEVECVSRPASARRVITLSKGGSDSQPV